MDPYSKALAVLRAWKVRDARHLLDVQPPSNERARLGLEHVLHPALDHGSYCIFVFMGNAGCISSTVVGV